MKISNLIKELESIKNKCGDVECLVEVFEDDIVYMLPVDELNYEDREGFGPSISLLC